jgi:hypothetical protein
MSSPADTIASFCENFTSRKFFALLIIVGIGLALFVGFEGYTSHFSISRTAQEVEILERLVKVRESSILSPDEEKIRGRLLSRIGAPASQPIGLPKIGWSFEKFLLGMSPWVVIGLLFLITPTSNKGAAFMGALFLALIFGFVASFIPGESMLLKAFVIPWGLLIIAFLLILVIGLAASRKQKQSAEEK